MAYNKSIVGVAGLANNYRKYVVTLEKESNHTN